MPHTAKWIFFDLGWTLVDESEAHRVRFAQTVALLSEHGVQSTVEQLWSLSERAAAEFAVYPIYGALQRLGLSEPAAHEVRRRAHYDHGHERLYPGVAELLAQLGTSYRLGVIANQSLGAEQRLRGYGIHQHFALIAASAELGVAKPDPRIFQHAAERAGRAPADLVMVGDRLDNDIAPARRLGWRTVRVLQGFSSSQQPRGEDDLPDHTISSIAELARVLA